MQQNNIKSNLKKTKIVCTIGPASEGKEVFKEKNDRPN